MKWILENVKETPFETEYTFRRPLLPAIIAMALAFAICIIGIILALGE